MSHNFLISACTYLVNKFVRQFNKAYADEKDASKRITEGNLNTLYKRLTAQVKLYLDLVDVKSVAKEFDSMSKTKKQTSSTTPLSLEVSMFIPAVLVVMSCEKLSKPCKYHITGQMMAEMINTSDTKLSGIKTMMLKSAIKSEDDVKKSSQGLHKKKQNWVLQ
jgi:hypothetical protein